MKAIISPVLSLALALALTSCETVINVPEPAYTPRLAVTYTLDTAVPDTNTMQHRQLYVSTSRRLFDQTPLVGRTDAIARLFDASGNVVEEFRAGRPYGFAFSIYDTAGYYVPTRGFAGVPGERYRLRVEAPGVEAVESTLTLPAAPATLSNGSFAIVDASDPYVRRGSVNLTIQDDPATTDYYAAFARVVDANGEVLPGILVGQEYDDNAGPDTNVGRLVLSDGGFSGALSVWPYADTDVQGRAFTFSANLEVRTYFYGPGGPTGIPAGSQLEIIISRLTRDTYQFWLSQQRYNNADGNPFAEPAPLYSNINPGYGLFGGAVDARVRVPL
jgi:Domain of unknown function (DUF4249)